MKRVVPARLTVKRIKLPIPPETLQYLVGEEGRQTRRALSYLLEIALYHSDIEIEKKEQLYRIYQLYQTLRPPA